MIKLHITPTLKDWPVRGGVREHMFQFTKFASQDERLELVIDPDKADILHVESAFPIPEYSSNKYKPVVYVCHGGFAPPPTIQIVHENLRKADLIVSVAQWIVDKYFQEDLIGKTVVIPNGVDLDEFKSVQPSGFTFPYILYAKEWNYAMDDFYWLIEARDDLKFVSTRNYDRAGNLVKIGLRDRDSIRAFVNDADALLLTGSEVCPTMLLEAWACSIPVIAKNIDGSKEIMQPFTDDQSWPHNSVIGGGLYSSKDDLLRTVDYVLGNKSKLGKQGRTRVEEMYTWPTLMDRYITAYETLLETF